MVDKKYRTFKHGMINTPTYSSWHGMKSRALNPNVTGWQYYGGRGIKVCERWLDFRNFLQDMGERPEGTSLERIDNDKGYEPGNCKWATKQEQFFNRRGTKLTLEKIEEMRRFYISHNINQKALGQMYGIDQSQVSRIVNNKAWSES